MNVFLGKWYIECEIYRTDLNGVDAPLDSTIANGSTLPSAPELIESVHILHGNGSGDEVFKINAHAYTYFKDRMIWMKWTDKYGFYKEYWDEQSYVADTTSAGIGYEFVSANASATAMDAEPKDLVEYLYWQQSTIYPKYRRLRYNQAATSKA